MPEHYLGCIEYNYQIEPVGMVLRRVVCGCNYECKWCDNWEEAIESYAEHRVLSANFTLGGQTT